MNNEIVNDIESLYKKYAPSVFRLCLKYVKNKEDAEDLVHDVFLKIKKELNKNIKIPFSWIMKVAVNECLQIIRKEKNRRYLLQRNGYNLMTFYDETSILDAKQLLDYLFQNFNKKTQKVILLTYFEGCTQVEISKLLGISRESVNKMLNKFKRNAMKFTKQNI